MIAPAHAIGQSFGRRGILEESIGNANDRFPALPPSETGFAEINGDLSKPTSGLWTFHAKVKTSCANILFPWGVSFISHRS